MAMAPVENRSRLWSWLGAAGLVLAYLLIVYVGLRTLGPRPLGALLAVLVVARLVVGMRSEAREHLRSATAHLAPLALLLIPALFLDDERFILFYPVLLNAALLAVFSWSLRSGMPIVERLARVQVPDLPAAEARYCRDVTRVWCLFFVANGGILGTLAVWGSLEAWALYTGLLSYLAIGMLFVVEFSIRKIRFRRFGDGFPDRIARALLARSERKGDDASEWTEIVEKGSVLGVQLIVGLGTFLGRPAVRLLMRVVAIYYVAFDAKTREASRSFHQRLGVPAGFSAVYRNVLRFAYNASDRIFLLKRARHLFHFERHGVDVVQGLQDQGRGAILIGAHFGSFEALRAAADDDGFPLSVVGFFDNAKKVNSILQALDPELASRVIHVTPDSMGYLLEIRNRIKRGELVALLRDRMTPGASSVRVEFLGSPAPFPTGPFSVAAALRCPVLLIFCIGRDPNVYEVHCEHFADRIDLPRPHDEEALRGVVQRYVHRLDHYARLAPDNWFNFYDLWSGEP